MSNSKNWMFTINNPTSVNHPTDWSGVKYLCFQLESGENETPHYQGYVIMEKRSRLSAMKKLHPTAHWEMRQGTHEQAVTYCSKPETRVTGPWISGEPPAQGKRTDLTAVKALLDSGASMADVSNQHFTPFVKYYRGFSQYRNLHQKPRSSAVEIYVYWGPPGTGKTRRAAAEAGSDAYWLAPANVHTGAVWWDGYDGQANVIIDEFYGWIPLNTMNRICDRYPMRVQSKGGSIQLQATKIWITSNKEPANWWPRSGLGAMERRITKIDYMGGVQAPWAPIEDYVLPPVSPLHCPEVLPPLSVEDDMIQ